MIAYIFPLFSTQDMLTCLSALMTKFVSYAGTGPMTKPVLMYPAAYPSVWMTNPTAPMTKPVRFAQVGLMTELLSSCPSGSTSQVDA